MTDQQAHTLYQAVWADDDDGPDSHLTWVVEAMIGVPTATEGAKIAVEQWGNTMTPELVSNVARLREMAGRGFCPHCGQVMP